MFIVLQRYTRIAIEVLLKVIKCNISFCTWIICRSMQLLSLQGRWHFLKLVHARYMQDMWTSNFLEGLLTNTSVRKWYCLSTFPLKLEMSHFFGISCTVHGTWPSTFPNILDMPCVPDMSVIQNMSHDPTHFLVYWTSQNMPQDPIHFLAY